MISEMVELTEQKIVLRADKPKNVGTQLEVEVRLPESILLRSFTLNGKVSDCKFECASGANRYIVEVDIGPISHTEREILVAYIEYRKREKALERVRVDLEALQAVFAEFGQKLGQLRQVSTQMKSNVSSTLELMNMKADKKTTIH